MASENQDVTPVPSSGFDRQRTPLDCGRTALAAIAPTHGVDCLALDAIDANVPMSLFEICESAERLGLVAATVHHIQNFADGRYYQSPKVGEWISGPLPVPGPRKLLSARSGALRKYTPRLALLAGQYGSIQSLDRLEAWISTTNDGSVHMLAPALNLFPVISNQLNGPAFVRPAEKE